MQGGARVSRVSRRGEQIENGRPPGAATTGGSTTRAGIAASTLFVSGPCFFLSGDDSGPKPSSSSDKLARKPASSAIERERGSPVLI